MELIKPTRGQSNWDTSLNAALDVLADAVTDHEEGDDPHGDRAWVEEHFVPGGADMTQFLTLDSFFVAHRGSGGEHPEHTLAAYESVVAAGCKAIEVSVGIIGDGTLICLHDQTLDRTTDATGSPLDFTAAELRNTVRVTPQDLLGDGWPDQSVPTLREVLDRFLGRVVIFIEPKMNEAHVPMQNLLTEQYPGFEKTMVYKAPFNGTGHAWAKSVGMTTWGFMNADTLDSALDDVDHQIDMWGVPFAMTDSRMIEIAQRGKPTICWEVHRHCDAARLASFTDPETDEPLPIRGNMCAQWVYIVNTPELTTDRFASQVTTPGTIGTTHYDAERALKYESGGWAYVDDLAPSGAILMGGHRAPEPDAHTITFSMKWPVIPSANIHSGIAFCREWDDPYTFGSALNTYGGLRSAGGYHVVIRSNGDMQLYSHVQGSTSGTQLDSEATEAPVADTEMTFEVEVTETDITVTRTDVGPYSLNVANTTHRGRYWHLSNGSVTSANSQTSDNIPRFKSIEVS